MRTRFLVLALLVCPPGILRAGPERDAHTTLAWDGRLPRSPEEPEREGQPRRKPLLIYIPHDIATRDQERFEQVVVEIETFKLASRFFERVRISAKGAGDHFLLKDVKVKPPAIVVFDSTRRKHAVARGRASAMKAWGVMRKIGQPDYETNMQETIRKASVLLGRFDRVDAARDSLQIKRGRMENALGKGDMARAKVLEKEIAKDQAKIDKLYDDTERRWQELWTLEIKKR
ncbi:MAG: hypothetical protein ACYTEZ_14975 [Planctomycetota bacterium]|jgi:hypothetical protein